MLQAYKDVGLEDMPKRREVSIKEKEEIEENKDDK